MSLRKYRTYDGQPYDKDQPSVSVDGAVNPEISAEHLESFVNMDNDARWQLLCQKVAQSKRDGTMTDADLDAFAVSCKEMLTREQYENMLKLISAVKGQ